MSLAPGARFGHYEILAALGSGGMGTVYRARDTTLGRLVAIKVPNLASAENPQGQRLLREAQHASSLSHPNICTTYEIGEADGQPFIVLEYIEGQPLSALIPAGGMQLETVVGVGAQIADALEHAHRHGVIHRDLKPANVVITPERRAKVLDFGLAQRIWHEGAAYSATVPLAQPDVLAGTIAYMAPEVLRGSPADAACDIWALGVMLHEMTTGVPPFQGRTEFELSSRILHEPPSQLPSHVPASFRAVVGRCLAKRPDERFQRAADIRAALEDIAKGRVQVEHGARRTARPLRRLLVAAAMLALAGATAIGLFGRSSLLRPAAPSSDMVVASLAVLPLENLSHDGQQEYLADGMTDALITTLSKLGEWRVISRTSVMQYKGVRKPLPEIARALSVDDVVEGSVLQSGDRVRISAQLIKAASDQHLWADSYERDSRDIFRLQSEVADAVATQIRGTLQPRERQRMQSRAPINPAAYDLYLRGRYYANQFTGSNTNQAIGYFQKAIDLEPTYALGFAGLADAYYDLSSIYASPREMMPKVRAAASRALQLDQQLAEALTALALVSQAYDYDWAQAEDYYKRALQLNPSYAFAREMYGAYLSARGRFAESREQYNRAQALDPLSPRVELDTAMPSLYQGRYEECIQRWRSMLATQPGFYPVHAFLGIAYVQQGRFGDAIASLERARELDSAPWVSGWLGHAYARAGRRAEAMRVLNELRDRAGREYVLPYSIAIIDIALGDRDEAFRWLDRGYEQRDEQLTLLNVDPVFAPLRGDPRFTDLLRRVRLDR